MSAKSKDIDQSTEEKIKHAAREVFHKKGYAATRTRDIAEEAGINLALLNYYFRSKEKLFEIIMMETMQGFFKFIITLFNDETTSFDEKIKQFVTGYIDVLTENPDIPIFVLTEIRQNPQLLMTKVGMKDFIANSVFIKQFQEKIETGAIAPINPYQFIISLLGMTVFPYVGAPLLKGVASISDDEFNAMMQERKQLIPKWIDLILKG